MLANCGLIGIVPTTNATRAREFYGSVLGLSFVEDDGFALVFALQHASIRIVQMPAFTPNSFTLLGWEVGNIAGEVQSLEALGVAFERYTWFAQDDSAIWTAPDGSKVAWFKDPDGNVLSLSQHVRNAGRSVNA